MTKKGLAQQFQANGVEQRKRLNMSNDAYMQSFYGVDIYCESNENFRVLERSERPLEMDYNSRYIPS